jgi:hypothetical protein
MPRKPGLHPGSSAMYGPVLEMPKDLYRSEGGGRGRSELTIELLTPMADTNEPCRVPEVCLACELQRCASVSSRHDDQPCPSVCFI